MLCHLRETQHPAIIYEQVVREACPLEISLGSVEQFLREKLLKKQTKEFLILISLDEESGRFIIEAAGKRPHDPSLLAYFPVKLSLFNLEREPFWLIDNDNIRDSFYYNWSFDEGFFEPYWLKWAVLTLGNSVDNSTYQFSTYPFALPKYLLKQNKRGEIPSKCNLSLPLFSEADFVRFAGTPIDSVGTTVISFPRGPRVYYSATSSSDVLDLISNFTGFDSAEDQRQRLRDLRSSLLNLAIQAGGFINLQIPPVILNGSREALLLFLFMTASGVYLRKNHNHLRDEFQKFEPICEEVRRLGLQGLCVVRHGDGPFGVTTLVFQFNNKFFRVDLPELIRLRTLDLDRDSSTLRFIFSRKLSNLPIEDCVLSFDPNLEVFTIQTFSHNLGLREHYGLDLEWTESKLLWFRLYLAIDGKLAQRIEHELVPPKIYRQASFLWVNQAPYMFAQANIGTPYENFFKQCAFPDWSKQAPQNRKTCK